MMEESGRVASPPLTAMERLTEFMVEETLAASDEEIMLSEAVRIIDALCEAAFLAGANPDNNGSRALVDAAIQEARAFVAAYLSSPE